VIDRSSGTGSEAPTLVILVDAEDEPIGQAEKLAAHQPPGQLHRALSAFVVDERGHLLIQRRAATKHSFPGAWSNSCCTHPAPGESVVAAAERRSVEELGLPCSFEEVGVFTYRAEDPTSGLVEHEVDHVLIGRSTGSARPNPTEVDEVAVIDLDALHRDLAARPERYTPWFALALEVLVAGAPPALLAPLPTLAEDPHR
jgi:isopentenyl-diphosphate delta-isomerase